MTVRLTSPPAGLVNSTCQLVSWEFNVPFQHTYGYIRDERTGVESYPYTVKEIQQYINLNLGHLSVQQPPKKGKGSRGSFKLLR